MKIHCIIHERFEGIGCIRDWIVLKRHTVSFTCIYNQEAFPNPESFDFLIIMGGSMSVYREDIFPVLVNEKKFIRECIRLNKTIIGICLGAQLLADILGAKVYRGMEKEIGWFPVNMKKETLPHSLQTLPGSIMAFHWHGDTFNLPEKASLFASSQATPNQGFFFGEKILALQFHYEVNGEALIEMIENAGNELSERRPFIQNPDEIIDGLKYVDENNRIMFEILDFLESKTEKP
jgi:GMP synthase-like glutamine amidotransferase